MAVDDLAADQSQRCQPRTVAMLPPTLAERPFSQRPEEISPFRSLFAGLSVAAARSAESGEEVRRSQRGRAGRYLSPHPRSRGTPLMRRINCQARLVSYSAIVRMDGMAYWGAIRSGSS